MLDKIEDLKDKVDDMRLWMDKSMAAINNVILDHMRHRCR